MKNSKAELESLLKKYSTHPDFLGVDLSNVNQKGAADDAPLHIAVRKGALIDLEALVRHGADVNQPGDLGNTPLHFAALVGNVDAAKALLRSGARRNILNEFYQTPSDVAEIGDYAVLVTLLKKVTIQPE